MLKPESPEGIKQVTRWSGGALRILQWVGSNGRPASTLQLQQCILKKLESHTQKQMPPDTKTSKFLSLVLRHKPDVIGLKLDASGWADIADLITKARQAGVILTSGKIARIVATSDKRRFAISDDGSRIRANQGHSVPVDLGLPLTQPPEFLYHGTAQRSIAAIRTNGILPMKRTLVHLSQDRTTATEVGRRHGSPVVLKIHVGQMHRDGFTFQLSENGVWLTEHVPLRYIAH